MTHRHLLLLSAFLLLAAWRAEAQFTPQGFNYQCIVRDATGASMNQKNVTLLFTVRNGSPNGPVAYSETQPTATNEFGLVNLIIGQGTPLQGTFGSVDWGAGAKFLTVSVETAPNVFDELGTTQLMSVPYALHAQSADNGGGDDWGTQVVKTSPAISGDGTTANPLSLAAQGAQNGQVLKFDGTKWVPQNDLQNTGTVTQINTGAGLSGGPITGSGTISLENTSVTPGVYGGGAQIPVITVDPTGRITDVFTVPPVSNTVGITGAAGINVQQNGVNFTITNTGDTNAGDDLTTSSTADGDVSGPFSNLQIKANAVGTPELADNAVSTAKIADNAVNSAKIADNAVITSKINNGAVTTAKLGDASVTAAKLNDMGATSGQVIKWNGTAWAPGTDNQGTVSLTAGPGIGVTGTSPNFTINNTGDTNAADDITASSQANGDVTGPFADLQLKAGVVGTPELGGNAVTTPKINPGAVTGDKIAQMSATSGQVLKWDGTSWTPAGDNVGSVTINAGVGIDVIAVGNNYTIANGGDINPFDDVTENSQAGGDLSGPFNNLQIKQDVVTTLELANASVATANLQPGAVTGDKIAQMSALTGQVLKWNGTAWAPATDVTGTGGDNWGSQVAVTGLTLSGNGSPGSPLNIAPQGANNGQVLKWNGTTWLPANDNNTGADNWGSQVAITSLSIDGDGTAGNPLRVAPQGAANGQVLKWNGTLWAPANDNNSGADNWGAQVAITNPSLDGDGTAGNPLRIAPQGATSGQVLKWNGVFWAPANEAGGDNWGSQTAAVNATLSGNGSAGSPLGIAQQSATNGQVLKWNGSAWLPANDNIGSGPADNWGTQVVESSTEFSGDGTAGSPLELAAQGATFGQVLKWQGTFWAPANDENTGDNWGVQSVETSSEFSGNGKSVSPLTLAQQGAATGQVLKWTGTTWAPANDLVGGSGGNSYAAGTGISITGVAPNLTINNTGDLSNTNELQTLSLVGSNLTLSNGGGTVALPSGNNYAAGTGINITGSAPNFTIVNTGDADSNPTNELQNLSLSGTTLKISGTNSTVSLDTILNGTGSGFWSLNGVNIYNSNSGNVGVGTDTPAAKFHVKSDGGGIRIQGSDATLDFANGSGTVGALLRKGGNTLTLATADSSSIVLATGGGKAVFVDGLSGNVGVGGLNNTPAKLAVFQDKGGFLLQNINNGINWEFQVAPLNGNLLLYNNVLGGAFPAGVFQTNGIYTPSDRRLKKDIAQLGSVLDKLLKLQPVSYRYKPENEKATLSIGFLAQDVQLYFPELITENAARDGNTYLGLNYSGFGVLAVKAIQEQQGQIQSLKQENDSLRERLNALEARMQRVENSANGKKN